jgi:hypothetical protein
VLSGHQRRQRRRPGDRLGVDRMNGLFPAIPAPRVPADGLAWKPGFPAPPPRISPRYHATPRHGANPLPPMTVGRLREQWQAPDRGYEIGADADGQLYAFRRLDRRPVILGPAATPQDLERLLIRDWAGRAR